LGYSEPPGTVAAIRQDSFVSKPSLEEMRKAFHKRTGAGPFLAVGSMAEFIPYHRLARLSREERRALTARRVKEWNGNMPVGVFLESSSCWWLSHALATEQFPITLALCHGTVLVKLLAQRPFHVVHRYEAALLDALREKEVHGKPVRWRAYLAETQEQALRQALLYGEGPVPMALAAPLPASGSGGPGGGGPRAPPPQPTAKARSAEWVAARAKQVCFAHNARTGAQCADQARCGRQHLLTSDPSQAALWDKAKAAFDSRGGKRPAGGAVPPKAKRQRTKR